jgi:D-alanine transaminase
MAEGLVWLNGEFTDFTSATVSIEDRGFQLGDGIYEVVKVYRGRTFGLAEHVKRLRRSAEAIELELPNTNEQIAAIALELVRKSDIQEAEIYIQVTRGAARRVHQFPQGIEPTFVMYVRQARTVPPENWERGIKVKSFLDERWGRCDIKSICLLPNVLAKERAFRAGAFEAIFVRDSNVMEGSSSNIFIFRDGELATPLADHRILPGITRDFVLQIARERGYNVVERDVPFAEVRTAPEVFMTSTTMEVMPVAEIDGEPVGSGAPGHVARDLHQAYQEKINKNLS